MARPLRIHVPGGFYHCTLRGNHRQPLFFTFRDRDTLDGLVADALLELGARLHAYCWMTNHLHLLVQVSDVPLGKLVLRIAGRYARIVQSALQTTGHLFERRYHAVLVDAENYILTLVRYIHLNPVRAGLVRAPGDYAWSSHQDYVGLQARPWVTPEFALRLLSQDRPVAQARYLELVGSGAALAWGDGPLKANPANSQVLGSDEFLARVSSHPWRPSARRTLEALAGECCELFDVTFEAIASQNKNRKLCAARAWLAHQATRERIASVSAVARLLARDEAAVRRLMIRHPLAAANVRMSVPAP